MKRIETGCTAMIINSRIGNNGKIVEIGDFLGNSKKPINGGLWEVSPGILTTSGRISHKGHECQLMRIDDYDEDDSKSREIMLEGESDD